MKKVVQSEELTKSAKRVAQMKRIKSMQEMSAEHKTKNV